MGDPTSDNNEKGRFLEPKDVAARWNVTTGWLSKLRVTGNGPKFTKISHKKILYSLDDILEYEQNVRRRSTSESEK